MTFQHPVFHRGRRRPPLVESPRAAEQLQYRHAPGSARALKQVRQSSEARVLLLTAEAGVSAPARTCQSRNVAPGAEMPDLGESIDKFYNPLVLPCATCRCR